MIQSFFFLMAFMILNSCATSGRIVEISYPYKNIQGIKLTQNLIARSTDDSILLSNRRSYSVSMIYLLEQKKNERPNLFLDVEIESMLSSDEIDSVIYINLNNEKIRIAASEYKSKEFLNRNNGSNPNVSRQFRVPENLWVPIVYSDEIQYQFFMGKEGFDVKLTRKETANLKEYFNRAIQLRDANLPPIPEGQKKW